MAECMHPHMILNPHWRKYSEEFENLSEFPHDVYLLIPCGKCIHCRKRYASDWRVRIFHELYYGSWKHCEFVTLTFADEYYGEFKDAPQRAVRLFLERYRKKYKKSVRHWFVTELGEDHGRLHLHGILFDFEFDIDPKVFKRKVYDPETRKRLGKKYGPFLYNDGSIERYVEELKSLWQYGNVWIDAVRPETANYIVKYITKLPSEYVKDPYDPDMVAKFKPRVFCSAGLGKQYTQDPKMLNFHHQTLKGIWYINDPTKKGVKWPMPKYYVQKIFTEDFRKSLAYDRWINPPPFRKYLNGIEYTDEKVYYNQLRDLYANSLRRGSSKCVADYHVKQLAHSHIVDMLRFSDDMVISAAYRTLITASEYESDRHFIDRTFAYLDRVRFSSSTNLDDAVLKAQQYYDDTCARARIIKPELAEAFKLLSAYV